MNTTNNEEWEEKIINLASNMFDVDFSIDDLDKKAFFDHIRSERSSIRRETVNQVLDLVKFNTERCLTAQEVLICIENVRHQFTNLDTINHEL